MNPLKQILARSKISTYATAAQLRASIGKPLSPCPRCGQPILSVLHDASIACFECRPELWDEVNHQFALAVALLVGSNAGIAVEVDRVTLEPIKPNLDADASLSHTTTAAEQSDPALAATLAWLASPQGSIVEIIVDADGTVLYLRPGTDSRRRAELIDGLDDRRWKPRAAAPARRISHWNPNVVANATQLNS